MADNLLLYLAERAWLSIAAHCPLVVSPAEWALLVTASPEEWNSAIAATFPRGYGSRARSITKLEVEVRL